MVTAGVYLIARMHPLFEHAPIAAGRRRDRGLPDADHRGDDRDGRHRPQARHRVLGRCPRSATWSWGVSSFAYTAGLFHLMTHAFFKALLFMAAGSVIGAMAQPGPRPHVGLPPAMPFTFGAS
jgi:NADH-quinone oxidoreductase subunit L